MEELYRKLLDDFKQRVTTIALNNFKTHNNSIEPVAIAALPTHIEVKPFKLVAAPIGKYLIDKEGKDKLEKFLINYIIREKPIALCTVHEAWMSQIRVDKDIPKDEIKKLVDNHVAPRKDPERIDTLVLNFTSYNLECKSIYEIKQSKNSPPFLEEILMSQKTWENVSEEYPMRLDALYTKAGIHRDSLVEALTFATNQ